MGAALFETDLLCLSLLKVFYTFSFWLMFRQQMIERKEELLMKEESLDEVKVVACKELLVASVCTYGCEETSHQSLLVMFRCHCSRGE